MTREVPLPRRVEIGTFEWGLHLVNPLDERLEGNNGMTNCDEDNLWIVVSEGLSPRKLVEIVMHELVHAIDYSYKIEEEVTKIISRRKSAEGRTVDIGELHARKQGEAWTQVLLDNPKFQRWLVFMLNRIRKERANA